MEGLSILIPTYNDICVSLVQSLHKQASAIDIPFEILVADDGSTDETVVHKNAEIAQLDHCRFLRRNCNVGRAAIRNYLAKQSSFTRLLFIDSDMIVCRADFIKKYVMCNAQVVDGGIVVKGGDDGNLRALYEHAEEKKHGVENRQRHPYRDFHTANFMIDRQIMCQYPFDERYSKYGYEDVAFGMVLKEHSIPIQHIDNPVSFEIFESNEDFVLKTEEGLRTLYQFREELKDYSRLLRFIDATPDAILSILSVIQRCFGSLFRRRLSGFHPSLFIFKIYKAGYYLLYAKEQLSSRG